MEKFYTKYFKCFLALIIILIFSGCAARDVAIKRGSVEISRKDMHLKVAFNEHDIKRIKDYYSKIKRMPPGLAKKRSLTPGLQKQLERNKGLPPGLQTRELPYDLERDLTPLPEGFIRLKVGGDVVILDQKTRVVVDVVYDVDL